MTIWSELRGTRSAKYARNIATRASRFGRRGPPLCMCSNLPGEEGRS